MNACQNISRHAELSCETADAALAVIARPLSGLHRPLRACQPYPASRELAKARHENITAKSNPTQHTPPNRLALQVTDAGISTVKLAGRIVRLQRYVDRAEGRRAAGLER
jgi:hypothetical protein